MKSIIIGSTHDNTKLYDFDPFIDNCEIQYDLKEIDLPYASLNFKSRSISNRVTQKIQFSFDVYAESAPECLKNYKKLLGIIELLKPLYKEQFAGTGLYLFNPINNYGLLRLYFDGFVEFDDWVDLFVTSFSYEINNELGYLNQGKDLIPIGFKISLEAKIPQNAYETVNISSRSSE